MNFLKKHILFLAILPQISIQSAHMFKKANGDPREIHLHNQKDLEHLKYTTVPSEELLLGFGPNDEYVKLAFIEEKANDKYQVHHFTLLNPHKSKEFSNKEDAEVFLELFMLEPFIAKRSYFTPLPARGSGQGWRSTSSRNAGQRR